MSTRWYPRYIKGNPQLRIFLPNFWLKLMKPKHRMPPNQVMFMVSMEMTKHDVKNYLEKIYKIPVVEVRTVIKLGEFRKALGKAYIVKDDDYKLAYVAMPEGVNFSFPDLFPEKKKQEELDEINRRSEAEKEFNNQLDKNYYRPGIPSWFGI